jgi:hypothetical protein
MVLAEAEVKADLDLEEAIHNEANLDASEVSFYWVQIPIRRRGGTTVRALLVVRRQLQFAASESADRTWAGTLAGTLTT